MRIRFSLVLSGFLLYGCGSNDNSGNHGELNIDSTKTQDTSAKVLVLPAPLQITTWLHQNVHKPEFNLLASSKRSADNYKTETSKALNLGVALTDLGYAAMFNDRQTALDHISLIKQLVTGLQLDNVVNPYVMRLEQNIQQQDSLSKLILTIYDQASKQLNDGKREKTALFITSGSFLEAFSVLVSSTSIPKDRSFTQLITQQRMMMDNLSTALTYLPADDETQDLFNTFYTLEHYYEPLKADIDKGKSIPAGDQFDTLQKKAVQLRDEILNK